MTKYLDKTTLIVATILVAVGILGGIAFKKPTVVYVDNNQENSVLGATGSGFHIETEWMQDEYYTPFNYSTTTTDSVATTSPRFIGAEASTTIEVLTAGVADIRFKFFVNSSTTLAIAPDITIERKIVGNNGVDFYPDDSLSSRVVSLSTTDFWGVGTTTFGAPSIARGEQTSFLYTNIDASKMRITFGSSQDVDLSLEIEKIVTH